MTILGVLPPDADDDQENLRLVCDIQTLKSPSSKKFAVRFFQQIAIVHDIGIQFEYFLLFRWRKKTEKQLLFLQNFSVKKTILKFAHTYLQESKKISLNFDEPQQQQQPIAFDAQLECVRNFRFTMHSQQLELLFISGNM